MATPPVEFCEPWTTAEKLCCPDVVGADCETGGEVPAVYAWTDDELIEAATGMLYRATCRLFPGYCQNTILPCVTCHCGHSPCHCGGLYPYIDLQEKYAVISVDEVRIDGEVIDASEYRLDDHHRLVRLNGMCWPSCNNLISPTTLMITFTSGRRPPIELQMAAAELACEMKRACNGGDCVFPRNVQSVSRQGITINMQALEAAVGKFGTGLAFVDATVQQYQCARAKSRVWHPSLDNPRQVTPTP